MHPEYTPNPLLDPLRRQLSRPQWQNLAVLIVALQLARTLIQRQLALYWVCAVSSASCYRRLERLLGGCSTWHTRLQAVWVRAVVAVFAPGRGRLVLLMDWTWHRDRCRSFWIMLPLGGRAVPVAFWLAPPQISGAGSQRAVEDAALTQLRAWLPWRRRVLLIGDRGFGGRDRMRRLKNLRFQFVLRVTGDTMIWAEGAWTRLRALEPTVGQRRQWRHVLLGKNLPKERITVNVVAVRLRLPTPKPIRTPKGKPTGQTRREATWFLVTDVPLERDAVALYQQRMQIEESFRDLKAVLGLERERAAQPWERLRALLWGLTIGMALDLQRAGACAAPGRTPRISPRATQAAEVAVPQYRSESAVREGLHELVVALLQGRSPFTAELRAIQVKSTKMQERPQVRDRRRERPALRRRTSEQTKCHRYP